MTTPVPHQLNPAAARVLAVLVEKQHTVPDTYPLSLNSLVAGCNQKTSREPVMSLPDDAVLAAINELNLGHWIIEGAGNRVPRYAHNMGRVLAVPAASVAILAMLILRGPQTAAELRANCERLYKFTDLSTIEAYLEELAERAAQPLVRLMPRAPGARESRWAHLLSGEPAQIMAAASGPANSDDLRASVQALQEEVAALRAELAALKSELGISAA